MESKESTIDIDMDNIHSGAATTVSTPTSIDVPIPQSNLVHG
jgi:hypothetical protein